MTESLSFARHHPVPALLACLVIVVGIAALGALFPPGEWYAGLAKPSFNPPNAVFGPAWTLLYLLIAVATWLLWRAPAGDMRTRALGCSAAHLLLNAAWTPVFFGLQQPGYALVVIVLMWFAILATVVAAWRVHRPAAWLLLPYLAWVGFATLLNASIWRLN
ncbi:TspO/MBR family protein [Arenimonas daejeonensis]|uniref:TspO/MBR family protein n=1 Tax=Arenimonas daejeonensis TaxID=370777 RepID=UPI0011BEDB17|nr:TspO/MBR family protein [Arenimonas daejeonensis]